MVGCEDVVVEPYYEEVNEELGLLFNNMIKMTESMEHAKIEKYYSKIEENVENIKEMQVPKQFEESHNKIEKGAEYIDEASGLLYQGFLMGDFDLLEKGDKYAFKAGEYLGEGVAIMENIREEDFPEMEQQTPTILKRIME